MNELNTIVYVGEKKLHASDLHACHWKDVLLLELHQIHVLINSNEVQLLKILCILLIHPKYVALHVI